MPHEQVARCRRVLSEHLSVMSVVGTVIPAGFHSFLIIALSLIADVLS